MGWKTEETGWQEIKDISLADFTRVQFEAEEPGFKVRVAPDTLVSIIVWNGIEEEEILLYRATEKMTVSFYDDWEVIATKRRPPLTIGTIDTVSFTLDGDIWVGGKNQGLYEGGDAFGVLAKDPEHGVYAKPYDWTLAELFLPFSDPASSVGILYYLMRGLRPDFKVLPPEGHAWDVDWDALELKVFHADRRKSFFQHVPSPVLIGQENA